MADAQLPNQVQLFNPEGELVQVPMEQAQQAQAAGYTPASAQEAQSYINEQKYGSGGQQALTALEGAAKGISFGTSSGLERALGVNPKDILGREEANPASSMLGEGAGIAASALIPGAGEANVAAHLGEGAASLAAHALPALGESNLIGKVGSAAIKGAVENAVFSSGDEVSKMILQDPNQSAQTAVANIGLGSLIGAGVGGMFGAAQPLWDATVGSKLQPVLQEIQNRANGNMLGVGQDVQDAIDTLGKDLSPEARSMYANNP